MLTINLFLNRLKHYLSCFIFVLFSFCLTTNTIAQHCIEGDSLALIQLYNDLDGANWSQSWNLNTPINTWHGVTLTEDNCYVEQLDLSNNNLTGIIPNLNLPSLKSLHLNYNHIAELPNFSACPKLSYLSVHHNKLMSAPNFSIANLDTLNLSYNAIKTILNFNELPNLIHLNLNHNDLTIVPAFNNLNSLKALQLSNNELTNIPNYNLPVLEFINLDSNQLSTIPAFENISILNLFANGNQLRELPMLNLAESGCLYVNDNDLNYNSIEPYLNDNLYSFGYLGQSKLPLYQTGNQLSVNAGGTLAENTYIWSKDGVQIATIIGDSTLTINETGLYNCEIENNIILADTNYTLYSQSLEVVDLSDTTILVHLGDVNRDGQVSKADILAFGLSDINVSGASRQEGLTPRAQTVQQWDTDLLQSNINAANLDGNGDGQKSIEDVDLIINNYGQTNPTQSPDSYINTIQSLTPELHQAVIYEVGMLDDTLFYKIGVDPTHRYSGYFEVHVPKLVEEAQYVFMMGDMSNHYAQGQGELATFTKTTDSILHVAYSPTTYGNAVGGGTVVELRKCITGISIVGMRLAPPPGEIYIPYPISISNQVFYTLSDSNIVNEEYNIIEAKPSDYTQIVYLVIEDTCTVNTTVNLNNSTLCEGEFLDFEMTNNLPATVYINNGQSWEMLGNITDDIDFNEAGLKNIRVVVSDGNCENAFDFEVNVIGRDKVNSMEFLGDSIVEGDSVALKICGTLNNDFNLHINNTIETFGGFGTACDTVIVIAPSEEGTHQVMLTTSGMCQDTFYTDMEVNNLYTTTSLSDDNICNTETVTVTVNSTTNIQSTIVQVDYHSNGVFDATYTANPVDNQATLAIPFNIIGTHILKTTTTHTLNPTINIITKTVIVEDCNNTDTTNLTARIILTDSSQTPCSNVKVYRVDETCDETSLFALSDSVGAFSYEAETEYIYLEKTISEEANMLCAIQGMDAYLANTVVTQCSLGTIPTDFNIAQLLAMDVNQDGFITSEDATLILKRSTNEIASFTQVNGASKNWVFIHPDWLLEHIDYVYNCTIPLPIPPTCMPADEVDYIAILLGDVDNGIVDNCLSIEGEGLDSDITGKFTEFSIKLEEAEKIEGMSCAYRIPVHCETNELIKGLSLDVLCLPNPSFMITDIEPNASFVMTHNDVGEELLISGYYNGDATGYDGYNENIFYLEMLVSEAEVSSADFDKVSIYLNNRYFEIDVTGSLRCDLSNVSTPSKASLKIYPNPTKDILFIDYKEELIQNIKVYDIYGKLLKDLDYQGQNKVELSILDLAGGTYLIKVNDEVTKRVVNVK